MDKYTVRDLYVSGNGSDEVYLASEVDARIAEMESALREIYDFGVGTFRPLEEEIEINRIARVALRL